MNVTCPACGSAKVERRETREAIPVPYGPVAAFEAVTYVCETCGTEGDFGAENTASAGAAIKKSDAIAAEGILRWLSERGVSAAHFERALRLPMRTSARWKSGEVSAAGLALLRLVRTYPWLLQVADASFEQHVANRAVIEQAARLLSGFEDVSIEATEITEVELKEVKA